MTGTHLPVDAPFHLEATVRMLQRRPTDLVDRWEEGRYLRLHRSAEGLVLACVENHGSIDEPELRLSFPAGAPTASSRREIVATIRRMLGLDVELSSFTRAARKVPVLDEVAAGLRGLRPPRFPTLFESLARTVPYQQLSLDAGSSLVNHFEERFGATLEWEGRPWYAFPTAAAIHGTTEEDFRALGFSHTKGRTLIEAGRKIEEGTLAQDELEALPTQAAFDELLALRGVGPWTASLLLLRGFGRLDAFPIGDVGVTRGLALVLGEDPKAFIPEHFAEAFGPERGMLYFYSLGAQLLAKGLITPTPKRVGQRAAPTGGLRAARSPDEVSPSHDR